MNPVNSPAGADRQEEVSALIETLHVTGQRLEDLTAGEVDTVTDRRGRTVMLRRAQDHMRHHEAAKQAAILNALPAHIALLDAQGRIISVNQAWRQFADANLLQAPAHGVGLSYLDICDNARGDAAAEAQQVAAGIRSVLAGAVKSVSLEYPCHSPTGQGWFLMTVTPLADQSPHGVVVMHLNITERKLAERTIIRLNRVYAVLGGINTLIVRVRDRDELFRDACRVAVDAGGFRMAMIAIVDRGTLMLALSASAGKDETLLNAIKSILSSAADAPKTMSVRAIREKRAVVSNDSQNDPQVIFNTKYADSGVFSMAVLPLMVANEAVGVLALYASEIDFFQEEELKLLTELAGDIAFAMDHLDKQERLNYLAYYDVLTGLANRSLFMERVAQYMRSAALGGHQLALFLVDLERFKNINDNLGAHVGDELLRQVAQWLTHHAAGDVNLLARVGADHFAVVLPVLRPGRDLSRLVDAWTADFQKHPFHLNDTVFHLSAKGGVALFPNDGTDAATLFKHAEAALKKAKASGERYLFYTRIMTAAGAANLTLENQLRRALDNEEFELYYQPKVSLASGRMTSAEALIRWNDPRTGLVPPGQFIPILEQTGLIHKVGRWALRQAIKDYLGWRAAGLPVVRIAVNVSPLQLRDRGFIAEVRQAISIDAQAAAGLELEITESLIMENVEHSIASLRALRDMGISIAIDDFGTGFSSLSYLSKFSVDSLKIDRAFVVEMTASTQGLALVSTIINLAHALKLKVVAEGVETEAQARLLRELDCDEMQGYLFSRPVPAAIFEGKFLNSSVVG
jgi:diguanylate cyclase (GGDEF)-like protein